MGSLAGPCAGLGRQYLVTKILGSVQENKTSSTHEVSPTSCGGSKCGACCGHCWPYWDQGPSRFLTSGHHVFLLEGLQCPCPSFALDFHLSTPDACLWASSQWKVQTTSGRRASASSHKQQCDECDSHSLPLPHARRLSSPICVLRLSRRVNK